MPTEPSTIQYDPDDRLRQVIAAVEQERKNGLVPDPAEWLARHPELCQELQGYFAAQDLLIQQVPPVSLQGKGFRLGDYEIIQEIGRGGMGSVYKACQASLNRTVALKVIRTDKLGELSAEERHGWVARFSQEAEAVASLDHPNIVPVYEVGEHAGQLFFSMKFCEGGSLQDYLERYKSRSREAARLVAALARALEHAHQRGILHRDLKPANVLLDSDGQPHISDFGLAKRFETDHDLTQSGAVVGTPGYMAPEQARADKWLSTRADVYGLGAILYALLTGRSPFVGQGALEILQQVLEAEPEPPRQLNPQVDADFQTICLKCLRKDPGKRYQSAQELADDLDRYLEGRPIQARPVASWERVLKWARRRPAAAALVMFSVAVALALTVGLMIVANREAYLRRQADDERNKALRQRRRAEEERNEALRQRRRANKYLHKAFEAGDELLTRTQARLANVPGTLGVRRDLLERARAFYENFFFVEGDTPEVRLQTGMAYQNVGLIVEKLGRYREALAAYDAALPLMKRLAKDSPNNADYRGLLAAVHSGRAVVLQALGRDTEAAQAYREALAVLSQLKAKPPRNYREQLVIGFGQWADYLARNPARRAETEKVYQKVLALVTKLCTDYPEECAYTRKKAQILVNLGVFLHAADPRAAEEKWTQALALQKKLATDFRDIPEYRFDQARTLVNLATLWEMRGKKKPAAQACKDATALLEPLVEDFPRETDYRHMLALAYTQTALILEGQKDLERAEEVRKKARRHWEKLVHDAPDFASFHQQLARSNADLARYLVHTGMPEQAVQAWTAAIDILKKLMAKAPDNAEYCMDLARTLLDLGQFFGQQRQPAKEEVHYRQAITHMEELKARVKTLPPHWLRLRVDAVQNLIASLLERKLWDKGVAALKDAIHYQRQTAAAASANNRQRQRLAAFYLVLVKILLDEKHDHAQVSRLARESEPVLRQAGATAGRELVHAAGLVARCIGLAEADTKLAEAKRKELAKAYGDQAMALLREAVRRGYRDAGRLRTAPNLQALTGHEDFRALLSELTAKQNRGQR